MSFVHADSVLKKHLGRQLGFLGRSAKHYDDGDREEAIRIAQALRVIFHDTKHSKSILRQLGIKDSIVVLTTIQDAHVQIPGTDDFVACLTPPFSPELGFVPPLGNAPRHEFVSVASWWDQSVIWRGDPHSRRDVVLSAANKDGGAHVEPSPDPKTMQLIEGVGAYRPAKSDRDIPLDNVHYPLLRQFAFEVLNSPDVASAI